MDNQLLVVKHWRKGMEHDPSAFTSAYLWMHVWNLLVLWLSRFVRFKLGEVFNSIKEVIIPLGGGGKVGRRVKLLVDINVTKQLVRGTIVKMGGKAY